MLAVIRPTVLFLPILTYAQYIPQSVLKLPPEATALKSWGLLKGSVSDLGDEVMKMMEVRSDIRAMQQDLKTQEEQWKQGELLLKQEQGQLQGTVKTLKEEVRKGEIVETNVLNLTHAVATEKGFLVDQKEQFAGEQQRWAQQRTVLQDRKHDLMMMLTQLQQQILDDEHAHEVQTNALMADQAGLRMKVDQLLSKISDMTVAEKAAGSRDQMELAELERQQAQLQQGLSTLTSHLATPAVLQDRLTSLQAQLAEETHKLLILQQTHNNEAMLCNQKVMQLNHALQAEEGKAQARHHEMLTLCQPVEAQQALLRSQLAACPQPAYAYPAAPAPAAAPVVR